MMSTYTVEVSAKGADGEYRTTHTHTFQASDEMAAKREATGWALVKAGMVGRMTRLRLLAGDTPVWSQTFGDGR